MCCTGIEEPRFIIYRRRRCKHSLHLGVVVGFVNWSGIVGGVITLKIDIKTVVAVDDRVAK